MLGPCVSVCCVSGRWCHRVSVCWCVCVQTAGLGLCLCVSICVSGCCVGMCGGMCCDVCFLCQSSHLCRELNGDPQRIVTSDPWNL